jgi:hypothetical protein
MSFKYEVNAGLTELRQLGSHPSAAGEFLALDDRLAPGAYELDVDPSHADNGTDKRAN